MKRLIAEEEKPIVFSREDVLKLCDAAEKDVEIASEVATESIDKDSAYEEISDYQVEEKILSTLEKKDVHTPKLERQYSQPQLLLKKSKSIMRNGSDFDDLFNISNPSLTTAKKSKITNQSRSALYSSIKNPKNTYYTNHSMLPNKTKIISQSELNSFNETSSLNSNYGYNGNNSNVFFKKCRRTMQSEEYNEMIEIVHMFNSKQMSKEETYKKISDILSNGQYTDLIKDFDLLFS